MVRQDMAVAPADRSAPPNFSGSSARRASPPRFVSAEGSMSPPGAASSQPPGGVKLKLLEPLQRGQPVRFGQDRLALFYLRCVEIDKARLAGELDFVHAVDRFLQS